MSIIFYAIRITFDLSGLTSQFITALGFTFETNFGCWLKRRISSISPRTPVYPSLKSVKFGGKPDPKGMILCSLLVELCYIIFKLKIFKKNYNHLYI